MPKTNTPSIKPRGRRGKVLTEQDFTQIKELIRVPLRPSLIRSLTGWSSATYNRVKNTETYEDYVESLRANRAEVKPVAAASTDAQIVQTLGRIEQLLSILVFGREEHE